jgi:hypothetical protein
VQVIQFVQTPAVGSPRDDDRHNGDCRQQPDHAIAAVDEDRYRYAMKPTLNKDHDPFVTLKVKVGQPGAGESKAAVMRCRGNTTWSESKAVGAHLTRKSNSPISFTLSAARQLSKAIVRAANGAWASLSKSKHSAVPRPPALFVELHPKLGRHPRRGHIVRCMIV